MGVLRNLGPRTRKHGNSRATRPAPAFAVAIAALTLAGSQLGMGAAAYGGTSWRSGVRAAASARAGHGHAHARKHSRPRTGAALKMIWGPFTMPDGSSAFPTYHRLGVQVLELQLSWAQAAKTRPTNPLDPADPAYHWPAALDQAVGEAARYGIQLALLVRETPAWANGGKDRSWAPDDPADYASFLQAASHHYPTIHDWMIWGEVTREGNFNPMPPNSPLGPERYAGLLDAAYGGLKAANPANMVIGGMTYTVGEVGTPDFLRWLRLPNGSPPRMDYYGHNPYSTRYPLLSEPPYDPQVRDLNDIDTLHGEVARLYRGHGPVPKLWLSEFGVSSDAPNRAFDYYVSRPAQAHWVTAAFRLADSVPYVAGLGWYELLDEPESVPDRITEGLMSSGGAPKPAFSAYARAPRGH